MPSSIESSASRERGRNMPILQTTPATTEPTTTATPAIAIHWISGSLTARPSGLSRAPSTLPTLCRGRGRGRGRGRDRGRLFLSFLPLPFFVGAAAGAEVDELVAASSQIGPTAWYADPFGCVLKNTRQENTFCTHPVGISAHPPWSSNSQPNAAAAF